jgi:hypothetical protein
MPGAAGKECLGLILPYCSSSGCPTNIPINAVV